MLERYAFSFYNVILRGEHLRSIADVLGKVGGSVAPNYRADFQAFLDEFKVECNALGLTPIHDSAAYIETRFKGKGKDYTYTELFNDIDGLLYSFGGALQQEGFLRIPHGKEQYLQNNALFGPEVEGAFRSSSDDIRNAGTCFALGLYDATVFHLMQILQVGLNAFAQKFNVPFVYANWEQIINDIENAVKKIDHTFGPDWREHKTAFSSAASQFRFLKDAIRNNFIHGRDPYDEGKALSVLTHVQEFMQSLATAGLSEPS